ncbi:E3 ubiquitin-protein ligase TRIM39 isoform X2 [Thalassophryne amazonica]|uniref:E3 ubiquitin-protein ligase TRIM39 isoform X2 n=1 Tax=Thalassophryne amazonica TaxID=390379 RepID=UPI0014720239|nr:E3 ubiquitin-protein ligase TRIM39 isoform X2 [Thalassophryne amazonica]
MALYGSFLSDEQFLCSICLDVFTNPSTTPCGHSFCLSCITKYWDGSKVCQCPLCKKTFQKRPELQISRTLREITEQVRPLKGGGGAGRWKLGGKGTTTDELVDELQKKLPHMLPPPTGTDEAQSTDGPLPTFLSLPASPPIMASSVPTDSTIAALIQTHLQKLNSQVLQPPKSSSHYRRRFTVCGAANTSSIALCEVHHRGLTLYCKTDQVCICPQCEVLDHQDHDTVTVKEKWMEDEAQLRASEQEIQEMISQRMKKIEEIRQSVAKLQSAVERETAGSVCLFSALFSAIEHAQAELMEVMEMNQRAAKHQADTMIRQLELEVEELQKRSFILSTLTQSDDHVHCVKTFSMLSAPPPTKDWSGVSVNLDLGTVPIYKSLAAQVEKFQNALKNIAETGVKKIQDYAVNVTLDPGTAHPRLILSEDLKSVRCGDRVQQLPDNLERFDKVVCVLGKEAISTGRHYWEVDVGGKTDWDLGVVRQSINRKGKIEVTPENGYWFLSLRDKNKYAFRNGPCRDFQMNLRPHKIGIFVDFNKGQVSFYNVDAKIHIYTFNDTFSENLFPFFSPCTNKSGKNDGALIIIPVNTTE